MKLKVLSQCLFVLFLFSACGDGEDQNPAETANVHESISLPENFKATVFADNLGNGRHLALRANGDTYLRLGNPKDGNTLVALRDTNNDGKADITRYFGGSTTGTGVKVHNGYLYYSSDWQVFRKKFNGNELIPSGAEELILTLNKQGQHAAKPLAFDNEGHMYVTVGAPSNSCQNPDRQKGGPGQDPCPLLDSTGGIWQFSDSQLNQGFADGQRYATGIRHAVGITWNSADNNLYAMQHGRDQLHEHWPEHFTEKQSAELPAEEFFRVEQGDDFGWPYCFFDWQEDKRLLNPEYGGNGDSIGRCNQYKRPLVAFPGHWAPNAITFYQGNQFPVRYKGGAFVAFHGSWNRAPFPQQGYKVVFIPFSGNEPIGGYDTFADEFAADGADISSPADADYRPCGLAVGPDGALYISDSAEGRIWKVVYEKESAPASEDSKPSDA